MKIRLKILSGFLILVAMLIVAGFISIHEFTKISSKVQALLDNNYKSIDATKNMVEALEREDSGILLILSGYREKGEQTIYKGDSLFTIALNIAKNNLTEKNEKAYVQNIEKHYQEYKKIWDSPLMTAHKSANLVWYYQEPHQLFLQVKTSIKELRSLNESSMYTTASQINERAKRAIMPGIVAIVAALIFSLLFNYFINYYFVNPIVNLCDKVENFDRYRKDTDIQIETNDEIQKLNNAIQSLINHIKKQA